MYDLSSVKEDPDCTRSFKLAGILKW
jgi:hypothetical protein